MLRGRWLPGILLLQALTEALQGQVPPPAMTPVRHDEDYAYLQDEAQRTAWWEHLKHVPLGERSSWRWTLGAELRAKLESYQNDGWGAGPDADHDYVWWRALPYLDLRHADDVRLFAQLIAALESDDEAGTSAVDENRADLLQAFADLRLPVGGDAQLTLRAGRQVLALGSERLVSARYGPNVLRSFDTAALAVAGGGWKVDCLWGRPVASETGAFDDQADGSRALWTLYGTRALGAAKGLDLYYIGFEDEQASFDQGAGREERHTLGARIFGQEGPWDWNFELFGQAGHFGDGDIRAWSIASDTGCVLAHLPLAPRLGLKANIISGDEDPDDEDLETFNPLFPKGKYFGEAGLIGPSNLVNVHPSLELALCDQWSVSLASVFYWRESTQDGIYDNAGGLLRPDGDSDARFIGSQLDLALAYAPSRVLDVSLACSAFVPGAFLEDTGPDETVLFLGLELLFRF